MNEATQEGHGASFSGVGAEIRAEVGQEGKLPRYMSFGAAIGHMKSGARVARKGWNGKGMYIFLTEGREILNNRERSFAHFEGDTVVLQSHIDMKDANGVYVSGWLASQADMLSEDWVIA